MQDLVELGAMIRNRQTAQAMKRLEPEIKGIRGEYERQIAERDAEIARLRTESEDRLGALVAEQEENEALKREVAMFKEEIAELKEKQAAPAAAAPRKGRRK
jgi:predicted  nucleic acid-binding Zn-ribbon protein